MTVPGPDNPKLALPPDPEFTVNRRVADVMLNTGMLSAYTAGEMTKSTRTQRKRFIFWSFQVARLNRRVLRTTLGCTERVAM
jgi:hypothetical protein